jgi:predicted RNase H-like nuclease (RuvC/YqgF family)
MVSKLSLQHLACSRDRKSHRNQHACAEELQIKIENIYYQLQKASQQVKATQAENTELKTRLLEQSRISEDAKRTAEEYER